MQEKKKEGKRFEMCKENRAELCVRPCGHPVISSHQLTSSWTIDRRVRKWTSSDVGWEVNGHVASCLHASRGLDRQLEHVVSAKKRPEEGLQEASRPLRFSAHQERWTGSAGIAKAVRREGRIETSRTLGDEERAERCCHLGMKDDDRRKTDIDTKH